MQYGDVKLNSAALYLYMGTDPANDNFTFVADNSLLPSSQAANHSDADLLHFWHKFRNAAEGSDRKAEAQSQLAEAMAHRAHVDSSIKLIGKLLFGIEKSNEVMNHVQPTAKPRVEGWSCIKSIVRTFEARCGALSQYGMRHMRAFAHICNAGAKSEAMAEAFCTSLHQLPFQLLELPLWGIQRLMLMIRRCRRGAARIYEGWDALLWKH